MNSPWTAGASSGLLRKVDKSGSSMLAQGPVPGSPRLLFRMGLYFREGDLRVFVDGVMVAEEFDARALAGGAFGLSAQGAEARWDHVVVRSSNPLDFFYAIRAQTTDASGKTIFSSTRIFAVDESGKALPSITIYRIRRDGLSFFVCQDPAAQYAPRSGFLREFERVSDKEYRVRLQALGSNSVTGHVYQAYEVEWLQDFLLRSARMSLDHVTADLHRIREIHLRNGAYVQSGTSRSWIPMLQPRVHPRNSIN